MLWVIAGGLFVWWLVLVVAGKAGLVHVILLNAIAIAFIKYLSVSRARA
jgi:hypothetical protein